MSYKFKALVVDDESQTRALCDSYKKYLKVKHNIDIDFDVINDEKQYDSSKSYDLLLVDYDLKKGFSYKVMGDEFIEEFRMKNKICKIIFYSSSFEYDQINKKYSFPFKGKEAFNLINELQVDRIAYKNNFNMMINVIKSCCDQMDILPLVLLKTLREFEEEDVTINYTNKNGEEMMITDLIEELKNDTAEGKHFRERMISTLLSVLLNVEY